MLSHALAHLGLSYLVYGMSRLGLAVLVLDLIHLDFTASMRLYTRFGPALLTFGMSCPGSSLFVLDLVTVGSPPFSRSFA